MSGKDTIVIQNEKGLFEGRSKKEVLKDKLDKPTELTIAAPKLNIVVYDKEQDKSFAMPITETDTSWSSENW